MATSSFAADIDVYVKMVGGILTYHADRMLWIIIIPTAAGKTAELTLAEDCQPDLALLALSELVGLAQES